MTNEQILETLYWQRLTAISTLVAAVAAILALVSIVIATWRIVVDKKWNKLEFTYNFLPNPVELERIEKDIDEVIALWTRTESEPLVISEVKALFSRSLDPGEEKDMEQRHPEWDKKKWASSGRKLKVYANLIEKYCAAINSGVADSDAAKDVYGFKFKAMYTKLVNYIEWVRKDRNENDLYIEWEHTVNNKWYPSTAVNRQKRY